MIQIDKSIEVPVKLRINGKQERRRNSNLFTRHSAAYLSQTKSFEFNAAIYTHPTVKATLKKIQHDKCCYCESHIKERSTVEHFRPKKSYRQQQKDKRNYPAYYWLAYEWENLYLACETCNSNKNDLFPLLDSSGRATSHKSNLKNEKPSLIDPGKENPENFITFEGAIARGLDSEKQRGKTTIDITALNRSNLVEKRLKRLQNLKLLLKYIEISEIRPNDLELQSLAAESKTLLQQFTSDEEEFLASVRCAMENNFEFVG